MPERRGLPSRDASSRKNLASWVAVSDSRNDCIGGERRS